MSKRLVNPSMLHFTQKEIQDIEAEMQSFGDSLGGLRNSLAKSVLQEILTGTWTMDISDGTLTLELPETPTKEQI